LKRRFGLRRGERVKRQEYYDVTVYQLCYPRTGTNTFDLIKKAPGVCRDTGWKDLSGSTGILDRAMIVGPGALCAALFFLKVVV